MIYRRFCLPLLCLTALPLAVLGGPAIDPIPNASIPAGKSLIIPVTATSPNGLPLTFTATSSTNRITVQVHTNNPFWKMSVTQAASPAAPGAYPTPFRGGSETVTNVGDMTFMLFRDIAPHTVNVFQGLTAGGLYTSNTIFHRVIAGFMIQGGDPLTNGMGGPVFRYDDEFHPQALFSGSGQLALANSGKDTDGSQFFVTIAPYRSGDLGYTIFGQIVRGFSALSNINSTATDTKDRPLAGVIITQASLVPDPYDTVLTLSGTNLAGVAGTIQVVADDGAGQRATNLFTATIVADANLETAFLFPNTVTNLVAPVNKRLTNTVTGYDFKGVTNNWYVQAADTNFSARASNSFSYVVSNQLKLVVVPNNKYIGPVSLYLYVSSTPDFASYDRQLYTFAFGDTGITATPSNFVAQMLTPFTNQLLATFTNGLPASPATNFSALINWGDNSTNSALITTNAQGIKQVLGSHVYTNSGDYPVYIALQSVLGASVTALCTATVPPDLSLTRSGTANSVGWPAWAYAYQLQSSANLTAANWMPVSNLPSLVGYQNILTNTTTDDRLYLRLKK